MGQATVSSAERLVSRRAVPTLIHYHQSVTLSPVSGWAGILTVLVSHIAPPSLAPFRRFRRS